MIFRNWVLENFPFLEDDFDALTDYELFCKIVEYMRKSLLKVESFQKDINEFTIKLNEFENYFDNLDVQDEVNAKLDEMVEDGTMEQLIAEYLQLQTTYTYNNLAELKEAENLVSGMTLKTLGYHTLNDNGGAYYKVRNVLVSDVIDDMLIVGLNSDEVVAELIIDNVLCVNQLGAYGDGTHDDTIPIQKALDTAHNISFKSNASYLVSKNTDLDYEDNDEPCLLIPSNKIVHGNGATLIVNAHGQGILEANNSHNVLIENLKLVSNGGEVPLDGTTGLGEKGNNEAGYDTSAIWGDYYNNSYDTSNVTLHGNDGNPWGMFNNGYIGNLGCGILIRNTSHNITVNNCEISGFNFSGIAIGTHHETELEIPECYDITITNNNIYDIYDAGIDSKYSRNISVINNKIHNIGHSDALKTDTNQNPGYGVTLKGSYNETSKCIISNNIINDCVRKGIDLHGGNKVIINSNNINNCMVAGIFSQTQYVANISNNITISSNQIYNCSYSENLEGAIFVEGVPSASTEEQTEKEVIITNNLITNSSGLRAIIDVTTGKNVIISGNMIKGKTSESTNYASVGILLGLGGRQLSNNGIISNNLINVDDTITDGIATNNIHDCLISNNVIKCGNSTQTLTYMSASKVLCYGNYNSNDSGNKSQVGLTLPILSSTNGLGQCQLSMYGDGLYVTDENSHKGLIPRYLSFMVEANGTGTPTVTEIRGASDYLDKVESYTYGFSIKLKNTNNNFTPVALQQIVSTSPITTSNNTICNYIYERAHDKEEVNFGIKSDGSSSTHYAISNCTSGKLLVIILL